MGHARVPRRRPRPGARDWHDGPNPSDKLDRKPRKAKPRDVTLTEEESAATIPLNDDAAALLRRWRSLQGAGARYVFPDSRGELRKQARKSDGSAIKRAAEQAGIAKNITPHVFRHTFGTWAYERTGDPKLVQRLMRHAAFITSMGYVHDRRELGDVVNRLPRLTAVELKAA